MNFALVHGLLAWVQRLYVWDLSPLLKFNDFCIGSYTSCLGSETHVWGPNLLLGLNDFCAGTETSCVGSETPCWG